MIIQKYKKLNVVKVQKKYLFDGFRFFGLLCLILICSVEIFEFFQIKSYVIWNTKGLVEVCVAEI